MLALDGRQRKTSCGARLMFQSQSESCTVYETLYQDDSGEFDFGEWPDKMPLDLAMLARTWKSQNAAARYDAPMGVSVMEARCAWVWVVAGGTQTHECVQAQEEEKAELAPPEAPLSVLIVLLH